MSDERTPPRGRLREYVAEEIRVILARKKMSGAELGRRAGIKQSSMSRRLTGETAFDMDDLEAIAAVLEISVAELLPQGALAGDSEPNVRSSGPTPPRTPGRRPDEPRRARLIYDDSAERLPYGPIGRGPRDNTGPASTISLLTRRPTPGRPANRPKAA